MAPAPADAATIDVGQLTTLPLAWAKGAVDYRVTDKERLHAIVRALSRALDADPAATVQVGGHASSRYAEKRNLHLGLLRARRLRFWLSKRGIPAARMKLANLGSSHPVTTDPGQERRNRRVTVQVLVAPSE